jgi:catechol-2,3-dioxygenase
MRGLSPITRRPTRHADGMDDECRIPAGTSIGHVHLKVPDLDRAVAFYGDVLAFELRQRSA